MDVFEIILYVYFIFKLEEDFRENARRTLNETATRNDTGYLRDWEDVQSDVRKMQC